MTPVQYRRAGEGVEISYVTLETPAGLMLIGATDRGICFVQFGDSEKALVAVLRARYPKAKLAPMARPHHPQFALWVELSGEIDGERPQDALPLDIRATAFQMRVWQHLQSIPYGDAQSYGEVASGDRRAERGARGGERLRAEPRRRRHSVPPGHPPVGRLGGLPLESRAQARATRSRTSREAHRHA